MGAEAPGRVRAEVEHRRAPKRRETNPQAAPVAPESLPLSRNQSVSPARGLHAQRLVGNSGVLTPVPAGSTRDRPFAPTSDLGQRPSLRVADALDQAGPAQASYSTENFLLRHAIGAWETNNLRAGVTVVSSGGLEVVGLSEAAFAIGPFSTDMGLYFYVYRFTATSRTESRYTFTRGMSALSWDEQQLRGSLTSVASTKTISLTASGLVAATASGRGSQTATGTPARSGVDTARAGDSGGASAEVPEHQRTWIRAGREAMAREFLSKLSSLQKLKAARIATWKGNTDLVDPKPVRTALEIAVTITASGMGGVVGKVLAEGIASALAQEFVKSAGKKAVELAADRGLRAALSRSRDILTRQPDSSALRDGAGAALTSKGDLVACFVEAQTLATISEEAEQATAFNLAEKTMTDAELADQVFLVTKLFEELEKQPSAFMAQMTMGLLRLMDEVHIEGEAADFGGDRARLFREGPDIDETDIRSGNLLLRPAGPYSIGEYFDPVLSQVTGFWALATEVNNATLAALKGTRIADLPFTLAFRFWGVNPYRGLFQDVFCKVWFVRRSDGTVVVDLDDADDENGLEWLSSYALGTTRELTSAERRDNSARGARKLYEALKDRPLLEATNFDVF